MVKRGSTSTRNEEDSFHRVANMSTAHDVTAHDGDVSEMLSQYLPQNTTAIENSNKKTSTLGDSTLYRMAVRAEEETRDVSAQNKTNDAMHEEEEADAGGFEDMETQDPNNETEGLSNPFSSPADITNVALCSFRRQRHLSWKNISNVWF